MPLTEYLKIVKEARETNEAARAARIRVLGKLSPDDLEKEVARVCDVMEHDRTLNHIERGGHAFAPLQARDRGLLECWLEQCQQEGRLQVIFDSGVTEQLDLLRLNHLVSARMGHEEIVVSGDEFRRISDKLFALANDFLLNFLNSNEQKIKPDKVGILAPLRAGLAGLRAWQNIGASAMAFLGLGRDELDAKVTVRYYEHEPDNWRQSKLVIVSDPMLASGGSADLGVNWCLTRRFAPENIVVQSVVAAPEGLTMLMRRNPGIRVSTMALDGGLNSKAFIMAPGLGDFGDHLCRGLTEEIIWKLWGATGILPVKGCAEVWARTQTLKSQSETK